MNIFPTEYYRVKVDGFTIIDRIGLPAGLSQEQRDRVRDEIAKDHAVPRHYIKLVPLIKVYKKGGNYELTAAPTDLQSYVGKGLNR